MSLSEIPKPLTDPPVRGFPGVWKFLLFCNSLPGTGLCPQLFCLSFYTLYFVLPPFEDNELPFWVPGVLHHGSEVVLQNLLNVQMIFWWIGGGESGLPVLFLHHLSTTPPHILVLLKHFFLAFWIRGSSFSDALGSAKFVVDPDPRKQITAVSLPYDLTVLGGPTQHGLLSLS